MPISLIPNSEEFITSKPRIPKWTLPRLIKHCLAEVSTPAQKRQLRQAHIAGVQMPAGCTWEQLAQVIAQFKQQGTWLAYTRNSVDDETFSLILSPSKEVCKRLSGSN